ncbi:MAG: hypothetical protein PF637_13690 [Spirochaetes bacterium]|jgi:hypothetical protein|nr:hypothetical protein [Spirochaetota bacterium]
MPLKKRVIIIHGSGLLFSEALDRLIRFPDIQVLYSHGTYYFKSVDRLIIRRLLAHPRESRIITTYQKLLIARMLQASLSPVSTPRGAFYEYNEDDLHYLFGSFGLPFSYFERRYRAELLHQRAERELKRTLQKMDQLIPGLRTSNGILLHEDEIRKKFGNNPEYSDIYTLIKSIQLRYESGTSVDSAVAAAFTTYRLIESHDRGEETLQYGKSYVYDFVEYYEGLCSLEKHSPAYLYINNIPPCAIPELEKDLHYLKSKGVTLKEYLVNNCSDEESSLVSRLHRDGLIKKTNITDSEISSFASENSARMAVSEGIFPVPGANTLLSLINKDNQTSITEYNLLQDVLCSPIPVIEVVETIFKSIKTDNLFRSVRGKKWLQEIQRLNDFHASIEDKFLKSVYQLFFRSEGSSLDGGQDEEFNILVVQAVKPGKGRPHLTVGEAAYYYKRKFPDAQYLFYCIGSRLLFFKRLRLDSDWLNPYELMSQIGAPGDGSEIASPTARPAENLNYPRQIIGNVGSLNFSRFVLYLSFILQSVLSSSAVIKNRSEYIDVLQKQRIMKIVLFLLLCFIMGLSILFTNDDYRLDIIEKTNSNFYNPTTISTGE